MPNAYVSFIYVQMGVFLGTTPQDTLVSDTAVTSAAADDPALCEIPNHLVAALTVVAQELARSVQCASEGVTDALRAQVSQPSATLH